MNEKTNDTRDQFELRGLQMTRVETFTDAAFAFALTLLVVSLNVPGSYDELLSALGGVPAFAASGSLLMMFWYAHHTWSRKFGLDDFATACLSVVLVFTVLVYVYPLKYLATVFMTWIGQVTGLGSEPPVSISPEQLYRLFVIYGVGFVAMCLLTMLLYVHAWRCRGSLQLTGFERFDTLANVWAWAITAGVGLASIVVALVTRPSYYGWPGWVYCLLPIVMPLFGWFAASRQKRIK